MLNRINSKANDNFIAFFKKEEGKREQVAHKISNFFLDSSKCRQPCGA